MDIKDVIDENTEKHFDALEEILHQSDLGLNLNQALSIYARFLHKCNDIAEETFERFGDSTV